MKAAVVCLLSFVAAIPVMGQTSQPDQHHREPTPQEIRDRMRAARPEPSTSAAMVERLKAELKLDPAQSEQVDKLAVENEQIMAALREQMKMPPETIAEMTKIRAELNKVQEAGDQAKMKELGDRLQQLRTEFTERTKPVRERMTNMQSVFKEKVRAVMHEDQREAFDRIWTDRTATDVRSRLRQNPRMLKAFVDRVTDLTSEQKTQIGDVFKQHQELEKGLKDRVTREQAGLRLYDSVMAILTPAQREQVEARAKGRGEAPKPNGSAKAEEARPADGNPAGAKPGEPAAPKP
ncbi:MAG: hypothetical protein HZA51_13130 [Planctomycetes bacterium]|nr:hypothetical protein [Planctomycetota bacterium]